MRVKFLHLNGRLLARGAAILLAGVAAGCSSGVSRFTGDMFTTASTTPAQTQQSYGGQTASALPAAPSGSVQRGGLTPVSVSGGQVASSSLPPLSPAASEAPLQTRSAALPPVSSQQPVQMAAMPQPANPQPVRNSLGALPSAASAEKSAAIASAKPKAGGTYTVASGDTLSAISRKTGVSVAALQQANGLTDGNIRIGQSLNLAGGAAPVASPATQVAAAPVAKPLAPAPATTASVPAPAAPAAPQVAAKAETAKVQPAAYTPPQQSARAIVEDSDAEAPNGTGIGKMRWPVRGKVIAGYGKGGGKAGDGIDIAVPEGTSVKAAENGVVIYAGDGLKEFGNTVLVRHENGLVTVYGHASELKVSRGQTVKRGQELALSGTSGSTESPKLHFEVRKNSSPVDPKTFLE